MLEKVARRALDSLEVWQTLLAAELSPAKAGALGRRILQKRLTSTDVLADGTLTAAEAQRAAAADQIAWRNAQAAGAQLITSADYPHTLKQVAEPPPALFAWGDFECFQAPTVGIVGTRGASTYGKAVAMKFAEALARAGVTVVSGGALGVDAAAHKGALSVGGRTVAVLAGGVDNLYPATHGGLFRDIRARGCLISQFAVGTQPSTFKFIIRNGLIAALSQAVLLIEAPFKSGALSTANAANELGRPVFVVPANIDNLKFAGSHALIRDGATLTDHPRQILDALGVQPSLDLPPPMPASESATQILKVLTVEPRSPEFIAEKTGLDPAEVLSELTVLELEGAIMRDAGGYAIRP